MNEVKKRRMLLTMKYTWPFYILAGVGISFLLYFVFGVTHKTPPYKTLTLFVSGEMNDSKKLKNDMMERFKENDLKSFSCISSNPSDLNYQSKLSIPGYNTADVLIIPTSRLDNLNVSAFGLELTDSLIDTYYSGFSLYSQSNMSYGVKIDKEKVKEYFTLPQEDCYMILNGKSENVGEFGQKPIKEHDSALKLVKDWGI